MTHYSLSTLWDESSCIPRQAPLNQDPCNSMESKGVSSRGGLWSEKTNPLLLLHEFQQSLAQLLLDKEDLSRKAGMQVELFGPRAPSPNCSMFVYNTFCIAAQQRHKLGLGSWRKS